MVSLTKFNRMFEFGEVKIVKIFFNKKCIKAVEDRITRVFIHKIKEILPFVIYSCLLISDPSVFIKKNRFFPKGYQRLIILKKIFLFKTYLRSAFSIIK